MVSIASSPLNCTLDFHSDAVWGKVYPSLQSFALHLVLAFHVTAWRGQETEIAEDIVQETMKRLLEYAQKAERGEVKPIYSLEHLMRITATNYCRDLRR